MSQFFIQRPIFACVISVLIVLAGSIFVWTLPIAQYPEITPPSVKVTAKYPGASSEVVAETVAAPIEQQVTGVENMLYMSSQSTNDGGYSLTVTFDVGTDLDMAQVMVQNRVNLAVPVLPIEVKNIGVSVVKSSPNSLLAVNLFSPDQSRDQLYLSNYATIRIKDELARIQGVGSINIIGQRDYSMRVWLDPNRMASLNLTASDVIASLREQNIQVAAGALGRPPVPNGQDFQYTLKTLGRLATVDEFSEIVVKTGQNGQIVKLKDVVTEQRDVDGKNFGGIEFGAGFEDTKCTLDGVPSSGLMIYQLPGSNALDTADDLRAKMEELKANFPRGVAYSISYDTTPFISESIHEVFKSLRDAIILVAIVVLVFLQSWRAAIIPLIAVPVAIIGTFAVMAGIGFSLNNLSLFGLVLAIGIVVDDAIVVVEAIEHKLEHGLGPVEAAQQAMREVTTPIIAISLVLMCVFIPCLFISGITGQFFQQFAATIAVSTFFSAVNSLTLSPALSALLLRPKSEQRDPLTRVINLLFGWFFNLFNRFFSTVSNWYANAAGWLVRLSLIVLVVYVGLLWATYKGMTIVPQGFVPSQDKGYLLVDIQLPDSASLERTENVTKELSKILLGERSGNSRQLAEIVESQNAGESEEGSAGEHESSSGEMAGVNHTLEIVGQSIVQNAVGSNLASVFVILDPFHHRQDASLYSERIATKIRQAVASKIIDARVSVFGPPPVDGLGSGGGFKIMVRDIGQLGLTELEKTTNAVARVGTSEPTILGMQSGFRANTPQMFVDVDREKCKTMNVSLSEVFTTLQTFLGGYYVNDFNAFGRTWQVNLQADPMFRLTPDQVTQLYVRSNANEMVPLGTLASVSDTTGPAMVLRYNGFSAAAINGMAMPGVSSGETIDTVERVVAENLPFGFDTEWTELTYLQIRAGNTALIVFGLAVVLVFLVLAAQYESLKLPLAVILVVPMCLLCAVIGVAIAGMDINIFVQIGFIVLVGLASKNAILIVEFAKEQQEAGMSKFDATIQACRLRLRPIIMTSLAFIFGVVPLMLGTGAGAEMRSTLGVAVFSGMLGVTFFGIFLTPVFYHLLANPTSQNGDATQGAESESGPS